MGAMTVRIRACGAVILEDQILMVRHVHDGRDYWTLPGGGLEPDETPEQAAEREVLEETGVRVTAERYLFTSSSKSGRNSSHCFLMSRPESMQFHIGADPEQAHLQSEHRMLQDVGWHSLATMENDEMVARVLGLLGR
jgi:ADP-ribose pyrophosphatase YjhB (NUDIX family)